MKRLLLFLLLLFTLISPARSIHLDPETITISLITCSPGDLVYERFGHSAIRIKAANGQFDLAFNYGIFDFNQNGFYFKFVKGETDYQLRDYDFTIFMPEYIRRDSYVWEQELNLDPEEKKRLIEALLENSLPQNREYRYNFIYDNCSTRPRDIIEKCLNSKLIYQRDTIARSFRDWVRLYVGTGEPVMLGIDLIFGRVSDKIASRRDAMFLPEILMKEFAETSLDGKNNALISKTTTLNTKKREDKITNPYLTFSFTFILLILIGTISFFEWTKSKYFKIIDTFIYFTYGVIGIIIFFLMFISLHPMVKQNINILWMNPLLVIAVICLWIPKLKYIMVYFHYIIILLCLLSLICYFVGIQDFNIAALPLIGLLLLRASLGIKKTTPLSS